MKRKIAFVVIAFLLPAGGARTDERIEKLPEEHSRWLQEEVVYIITEREKEIFLLLESREERDGFIEAFWRRRDPKPATPHNEFREEHQRRLDYANRYLGRASPSPGWKSDRGRSYIKLGKPQDIQRFPATQGLVPIEQWFYSGDPNLGLPAHFYLLFFKQHSYGEYRLYHPAIDGPGALMVSSALLGDDNPLTAVENLQRASPELARASLSLDLSEPADFMGGRPAPGTEGLLARIEEAPKRLLRPDYADDWLRFRDRVSAEYSFKYVPHQSFFATLVAPDGTAFVNYSIELEPKDFALEGDETQTKFYTTLDITMELRNEDGDLVVSKDKSVYLELTPSQLEQVAPFPFAYQDNYPVLPGDYTMNVVVRNRVLKQFTVAERELRVPSLSSDRPILTDIIAGYMTELIEDKATSRELRTFQVGGLRIHPATNGVFPIGGSVHAFFQVVGGSPDHELRFSLSLKGQTIQQRSSKVGAYQGGPVIERFVLDGVEGGVYDLGVQLLDPSGDVVAEKATQLNVSPRSVIPRPAFVFTLNFNTAVPGMSRQAIGEQLLTMNRYDEARSELEKALAENGEGLPVARWLLAEAYNRSNEPDRALSILEPMEAAHLERYEVLFGLGYAHYLKDDEGSAVGYLERAMAIRAPSITHLNALADCYRRLGKPEKSRETLERSLELDPDQTTVKEQLDRLSKSDERGKDLTSTPVRDLESSRNAIRRRATEIQLNADCF